jgi:hypothetical protein
VALFSGGATYEYTLELPPARGNLQPAVRLSYNSRRVDGLLAWVQDWVGIGWSVDLMDIVRDEARYCWPGHSNICLGERFLLVMNGTAYELEPPPGSSHGAPGRYYARNAPYLWIQFHKGEASAPNEKKSYWLVRTPEGTTYRLGYTWNSEQVLPYVYGADQDPARSVYRWRLDQAEDSYGNRMEVNYREWGDNNDNRASVLAEIRYNQSESGWGTRILFIGADFQYEKDTIFYDPQSLQRIEVWHAGQRIRTYEFSYGEGNHWRRVLREIRVLDGNGQLALPVTRFGYEDYFNKAWCGQPCGYCIPGQPGYDEYRCEVFAYPRLKWVENGFGARIEFIYESDGRGDSDNSSTITGCGNSASGPYIQALPF